MCPRSSTLLKSVELDNDGLNKHPLVYAINEGFNVGINSDDPGIFCTTLIDDYNDVVNMGLNDVMV